MKPAKCPHCQRPAKVTATRIIPVHTLDCPEAIKHLQAIRDAEEKARKEYNEA